MNLFWNKKQLGNIGELIAGEHLKKAGYNIVEKNYLTKSGEIDIIAKKDDTLIFLEVKTRTSKDFGFPEESIVPARSRRIRRVAEIFFAENNCNGSNARFDVVSIQVNMKELEKHYRGSEDAEKLALNPEKFCRIIHIKNAF